MEFILRSIFLANKIRGKNEFEVFKNYVNDVTLLPATDLLDEIFLTSIKKDNSKSIALRKLGNDAYCKKEEYEESLIFYNKSLCFASYNSEAYATTLANRSAIYFKIHKYEACIKDINWCLQAKYPDILKPKIYIRKAECYQKLGDALKMRNTLLGVLNFIDETPSLPKSVTEKYKETIKNLIIEQADKKCTLQDRFDELPIIEANPSFSGASTLVELQYSKRNGHRVVAKSNIKCGDVLFVEKAFTFIPNPNDIESSVSNCQNCLIRIRSFIPCKGCTELVYCSDECRDSAWNDFHQWECVGIQAGLFEIIHDFQLVMRVLFKGLHKGLSTNPMNFEGGEFNYDNADDLYPYIYNVHAHVDDVSKDRLLRYASTAVMIVSYLKLKTDFFKCLKKHPSYSTKNDKEIMNRVGGLIIRHCIQLRWNDVPVQIITDESPTEQVLTAVAVCPSVTKMTHSCAPNTIHYFLGDKVVVKAAKNIKPKETICRAYGNITYFSVKDTNIRRKLLEKLCSYKCKCEACTNPRATLVAFNAYFCIKCKGPAIDDDDDDCTCLDCNYNFELPSNVVTKTRSFHTYFNRFQIFGDIEDANESLQIGKTIFKPYHEVFADLYLEMSKYYIRRGNIVCFWKMAKMIFDYFDKTSYGAASIKNGCFRYKFCKAVISMLELSTVIMDLQILGKILEELLTTIDEAKVIFTLHYPPFLSDLENMKKSVFELQLLYGTRTDN